jgi:hypothetical protein
LKKVVEETAHTVGLYRLPVLEDGKVREMIFAGQNGSGLQPDKILLIGDGEVKTLGLKTGLSAGRYLDEAIDEKTEYVFIPGALTESVVADSIR